VSVLTETWKDAAEPGLRAILLRALSSFRERLAIEFLLEIVRTGRTRDAEYALEALKLHEGPPDNRTQVEEARRQRTVR
jgi:hypothetical protein